MPHSLEEAAGLLVLVMLGLFVYGRWTGQSFSLNLLGPNAFGATLHENALAAGASGQAPTVSPAGAVGTYGYATGTPEPANRSTGAQSAPSSVPGNLSGYAGINPLGSRSSGTQAVG